MATLSDEMITSMLTVRKVAQLLDIHPNTVRRWSDLGLLQAYRITSRGDRRFKREDIDRFLIKYNHYLGDAKKASLDDKGLFK